MSALDPHFGTTLRIFRESLYTGERTSAEARLIEFARRAGLSLEQAIAQHERPAKQAAARNIFAGFDDWMEEREPGHKARCAAAKAEKERQRVIRRDAAVAHYGSEEAVLAPCAKEMLLRKAVAPWRKASARPYQRWTASVDGYRHFLEKLPLRVAVAIGGAYPLPTTFSQAREEHSYWLKRRQEIEDVLVNFGDDGLDLLVQIRLDVVRKLLETGLRLDSLKEIVARLGMTEAAESAEPEMVKAVYRDLKAYVERGHER